MGICPENGVQTNLLDYDPVRYEKLKRLDEVIDRINRENGSETIVLGSQQYTAKDGKGKAGVFRDSIKHDFRSPNYTTRWSDIPKYLREKAYRGRVHHVKLRRNLSFRQAVR